MLKAYHTKGLVEAGCDEAGRGCLAGPVFAAAVILPERAGLTALDDSKKLSAKKRYELRTKIEKKALAFAVARVEAEEIDEINILNASFLAMHRALDMLKIEAQEILVDGNRFKPYNEIPYHCIIKGDGIYRSIAAASILAKTYRDDYMEGLHAEFPQYDWHKNMGYPTKSHRLAIAEHGITIHHRRSFRLTNDQLELQFNS